MPDYKTMYCILCAGASEALDALPEIPETHEARFLLQSVLDEAEEVYIHSANSPDQDRPRPVKCLVVPRKQ